MDLGRVRRWQWAVGTVVLLLGVVGGGVFTYLRWPVPDPRACTLIGGSHRLDLTLTDDVRDGVSALRVTLRADDRESSVEFDLPASPQVQRAPEQGVDAFGDHVGMALEDERNGGSGLGGGWEQEPGATAVVRAIDVRGRTVLRHEESFRWRRSYPNGKECDGDGFVSHTVTLAAGDRV